MRSLLLGLIILLTGGFTTPPPRGVLIHRFIVQPNSRLIIDGKTNINTFQCAIIHYTGKDTLELREGGKYPKPIFTQGYVGLEAARFDCGLQVMTNDFWKTIKYKEYPLVGIEFISFERLPKLDEGSDLFRGRMQIALAGTRKPFDVDCSIETDKSGMIHLKGSHQFTFSDFELEPPSRMMGLVKVEDLLMVNFHLVLLLDMNG
ncbi:MAG: hypothetical protein AB7O48_07385 [Cyclobacteriaceae bacterium]